MRDSRQRFLVCASGACPRLVQSDCLRWATEVDAQIPSVVFRVTVDGEARMDAKVIMDGEVLLARLTGKALEVEPGMHRFRFEVGTFNSIEQNVIVGEGEKLRVLSVAFDSPATDHRLPSERRAAMSPAGPTTAVRTKRKVPAGSYVLAGLGTVGVASFTAWGLSSRSLKTDLEETCAPGCTQNRIDEVYRRAVIADVSLGIGVASLAGSLAWYLLRPTTFESVPAEAAAGRRHYEGGFGHAGGFRF
ncbi:hypothetical protein ACFL5O_07805 [Myxococcota bacterium]